MLHLLGVPAAADAEEHAAAREMVEARHLLGERDRIALDDQADAGADLEAGGDGGRRRQGHEGIECVPVLLRQIRAAGPGAAPADRNVRVLGHEQGLEAARLGLAGQLVDADRVIGAELVDAVFHGWAFSSGKLKGV
jgi:hypothetical protein